MRKKAGVPPDLLAGSAHAFAWDFTCDIRTYLSGGFPCLF